MWSPYAVPLVPLGSRTPLLLPTSIFYALLYDIRIASLIGFELGAPPHIQIRDDFCDANVIVIAPQRGVKTQGWDLIVVDFAVE